MGKALLEAAATVGTVFACARLMPGLAVSGDRAALAAGLALAALYLLLRPLARLLTKPLGCLTFGLIGTAVDAALVELCAYWLGGDFRVESFLWAAAVALAVNLTRGVIGKLFCGR